MAFIPAFLLWRPEAFWDIRRTDSSPIDNVASVKVLSSSLALDLQSQ